MEAGLAMERSGRLYRLDFSAIASEGQEREIHVAAAGIWEQRDDLYSLDFAPGAGEDGAGLIALGHHALGLTAIDGRGRLLWRLGPRDANAHPGRTWREHQRRWTADLCRRSWNGNRLRWVNR
jgi:hypothetical protein